MWQIHWGLELHAFYSFPISPTVRAIAVKSEEKPVTQIPRGASKSEAEREALPSFPLRAWGCLYTLSKNCTIVVYLRLLSQCHLISGTRIGPSTLKVRAIEYIRTGFQRISPINWGKEVDHFLSFFSPEVPRKSFSFDVGGM